MDDDYEVIVFKDATDDKIRCLLTFRSKINAKILCKYVRNGFELSDDATEREKIIVKGFEDRFHNLRTKYNMTHVRMFTYSFFEYLVGINDEK